MSAIDRAAMAAIIADAQARTPPGQDRGPSLLAIQVVMMMSATTAVVLRFVSRRIGPGIWWDDWIILAALVCVHLASMKVYSFTQLIFQIPSLGGNIINIVGQ